MMNSISGLSMYRSLCFFASFNPNPLKCPLISLRRHLSTYSLRPPRSELSFTVGTHLIPHPAKAHTGGEDAFFVSRSNGGVLAIADGVSGWAERGVNPALFSRELMANASNFVMDEEVLLLFRVGIPVSEGYRKDSTIHTIFGLLFEVFLCLC
ncbi:probable protein phosphatase 2C 1 isoform X2 [Phalaenopsis equestris]|uniref:probable protein phosphatase 2C 1 isoform X2 n=1 Tax=Phalaenopsis equestris TaxID=78828 RepID=UPI0009E50D93|nr:probable protein phosphatase 2C 1 isoform X2 [Phalaenopsis equestris]